MKHILRRFLAVASMTLCLAGPAPAATPYGYAGNAGWLGFGPASAARVNSGATFLSGFAYAANFGWINFGDGTPGTGSGYSNASADDFGINHDGTGQLSGYAYSANIGWINFSWASPADANRPRIDLVTGVASGFAYSANAGWIDLSDVTMPGVTASVRFPSNHPAAVAGNPLTLSVAVFGSEALKFQWLFNGVPIPGATGATLTLPSIQAFHAGDYAVVITRADGSTFAVSPGTLIVTTPPPSNARLLNLSTRGHALTGDNILIPGFVISGTGTKRLLLRAVGPTLHGFVNGELTNPTMTLKRYDTTLRDFIDLADNDDWGTNANAAEIATTAPQVGAFDLTPDSADAALLLDLAPGKYSVIASGVSEGSGIAIVELYDVDDDSPAARLVNISTRGHVGTGDSIMIPGFVVSEEGSRTFLIRAVGPTLTSHDVPGALEDPTLTIYLGQTAILANDDWGQSPESAATASVAAAVGAFPLNAGSKDAALVVTLPPGVYTVHARGVGDTTGIALVEIYLVP